MIPISTSAKLLLLTAAAVLSGCAVYPAPGYGPYETYGVYGQPYGVNTSPGLISGSVIYEQHLGGSGYHGNSYGPPYAPGYRLGYGPNHGGGHGRSHRENRGRNDRDGDGVRNGRDGHSNNRSQR